MFLIIHAPSPDAAIYRRKILHTDYSQEKKYSKTFGKTMLRKLGDDCNSKFVGAVRFELTTLCSQSRYANRTALCPELILVGN